MKQQEYWVEVIGMNGLTQNVQKSRKGILWDTEAGYKGDSLEKQEKITIKQEGKKKGINKIKKKTNIMKTTLTQGSNARKESRKFCK